MPAMSVPRTDEAEPQVSDAVIASPGWAPPGTGERPNARRTAPVEAGARSQNSRIARRTAPVELGQGRRTRTLRGLDGPSRGWGKVARPRRPAVRGAATRHGAGAPCLVPADLAPPGSGSLYRCWDSSGSVGEWWARCRRRRAGWRRTGVRETPGEEHTAGGRLRGPASVACALHIKQNGKSAEMCGLRGASLQRVNVACSVGLVRRHRRWSGPREPGTAGHPPMRARP